jgi:hypothetical protein
MRAVLLQCGAFVLARGESVGAFSTMRRLLVKRLFVSANSLVERCGTADQLAAAPLEGDERGTAGEEGQANEEKRGH